MGAGMLVALLLWILPLFGLTDWRRGWWRSKHHTESGTQVWGLEIQVWMGDLYPLIGQWWVGLTCAWGTSGRVCFGVPSWATLVHESPCDTVRLVYDLAP